MRTVRAFGIREGGVMRIFVQEVEVFEDSKAVIGEAEILSVSVSVSEMGILSKVDVSVNKVTV